MKKNLKNKEMNKRVLISLLILNFTVNYFNWFLLLDQNKKDFSTISNTLKGLTTYLFTFIDYFILNIGFNNLINFNTASVFGVIA